MAAAPALPVIAKGNAGIPKFVEGAITYDGTPELMADYAVLARDCGAKIIGGCCGTTPEHLVAMRAGARDGAARAGARPRHHRRAPRRLLLRLRRPRRRRPRPRAPPRGGDLGRPQSQQDCWGAASSGSPSSLARLAALRGDRVLDAASRVRPSGAARPVDRPQPAVDAFGMRNTRRRQGSPSWSSTAAAAGSTSPRWWAPPAGYRYRSSPRRRARSAATSRSGADPETTRPTPSRSSLADWARSRSPSCVACLRAPSATGSWPCPPPTVAAWRRRAAWCPRSPARVQDRRSRHRSLRR